ncbi:MAG: hypothetical protein HY296_05735 [Thaumarchaeota archaeon]|nr:hypothetical protein [Nitrososphaerota archaeon]
MNFEYKKEVAAGSVMAVFGVVILTLMATTYFPVSAKNTSSTCSATNPPADLYSGAPILGYTYSVFYNTTNGGILTVRAQQSCQLGGILPEIVQCTTKVGAYAYPSCTVGQPADEAVLNATADPSLRQMMTNGYINAFYVNVQTKLLTPYAGVTFSANYKQAYYNGQPITNGTRIAGQ